MKPLTPRMVELLKAMANGKRVHFSPYMGRFNPTEHYFCNYIGSCTKQANALLIRGLVRRTKVDKYSGRHDLELTFEGRLAATENINARKERE